MWVREWKQRKGHWFLADDCSRTANMAFRMKDTS
jgi:hypothetical protein